MLTSTTRRLRGYATLVIALLIVLTMLQIAHTLGVGRSTTYQHLDLLDYRQVGDEGAPQ